MKKTILALSILCTLSMNALPLENNEKYMIKIMNVDSKAFKVDNSSNSSIWTFDHYEYRNQTPPVETSVSQYLPPIIEQEESFIQTATKYSYYTQDRVTIEVNGSGVFRETNIENETINQETPITREIIPILGQWSPYGGLTNCTEWDKSEDTVTSGVNYTKNRTCDKTDSRIINYTLNGNNLINKEQFKTVQVVDSQQTSGTKSPTNVTPQSAAGKIQFWTTTQTVHSGYNTLTDGSLFNGSLVFQGGKCANLYAGSGYNYIRFTVTEPLYLSVATHTYNGILKVGTQVNSATPLAQVSSVSGQLVTLGALLQPNTTYFLWTSGDVMVCELGAAQ